MRPEQDLRRIPADAFAPVPDRLVQHAGQAQWRLLKESRVTEIWLSD